MQSLRKCGKNQACVATNECLNVHEQVEEIERNMDSTFLFSATCESSVSLKEKPDKKIF